MLNDMFRALSNTSRVEDIVIVTSSYEEMNLVSQFNKAYIVHDEGVGRISAVMKAIRYYY